MDDPILQRIEREAGLPGLIDALAERLAPADLQSLLLAVAQRRASARPPAQLLADWGRDRFVRPSPADPRKLLAWETAAWRALPPEFEALALSPVCPLGTASIVAGLSQNLAVATMRGTEVVSDSTNVLALECAVRRRESLRRDPKSTEAVHLATSHRLLRTQRFADPKLLAHFEAFALCSAGRDIGRMTFELAVLTLHAGFYAVALRDYLGPEAQVRLSVTPFDPELSDRIEAHVFGPLRSAHPGLTCVIDLERTRGRGYYQDACFHIHLVPPSGDAMELADGGSVPWTRTLLSNAKERLFISGIGSERMASF